MNDLLHTSSLSFLQRHVWQLMQQGASFRSQCAIQINDNLDINKLLTAIHHVVERHEILRTRYYIASDASILQPKIYSKSNFIYTYHDFSELHSIEQQLSVEGILNEDFSKTLNSHEDFPLCVEVICQSDYKYIVIVRTSALAVDSYSLKNIVSEVCAYYSGKKIGNAEIIQYSKFSNWINELIKVPDEEAIYFWEKYCKNQKNLVLPFEKKNIASSGGILKKTSFKIDTFISERLNALVENNHVSVSSVALAALSTLLSNKVDDEDMVIRNIINSRDYEELEPSVGLISKTLPILIQLKTGLSFIKLARQIEDTREEVIGWGNYFFSYKQEAPLNEDTSGIAVEYLDLSHLFIDENKDLYTLITFESNVDKFKLKLFLTRYADSYEISFYYNPDWFWDSEIEVLKNQMEVLFKNALQDPNQAFDSISIISENEIALILNSFSHSPSDTLVTENSIVDAFYKQVAKTPDLPAVEFEEVSLSYKELDRQSNQLANYLISNYNVKPKDKIALMMGRSEMMIVSLLGILKTGATFLPVDHTMPAERKRYLINDAGIQLLMTESSYMFDFSDYTGNLFAYDIQFADLGGATEKPTIEIESCDAAYIIYTSGSTGNPKGVKVSHHSLMNYVNWFITTYHINEEDTSMLFSSIAFDLCYTSLWPTLVSGGKLCLHKENKYLEPEDLLKDILYKKVTFIKLTPSHLRMILMAINFPEVVDSLNLRLIILGGEELKVEDVEKYFSHKPDVKFVNHYGPTETTIGTIAQNIEFSNFEKFKAKPVIGKPICNNSIFILNEDTSLSSVGVPGEIGISGPGLSLGYLNRPDLTTEKFIDNPYMEGSKLYLTGDVGRWLANGSIEFLGRKDNQVKVRGYRVELGEVDAVLNTYPFIKEAVSLVSEVGQGETVIKAYIVCNEHIETEELKRFLDEKLPEYMIPSQIIEIEKIPLTLNGKIDRKKLLAIEKVVEKEYEGPRNKIEAELIKIWEEVLVRKPIGIKDDFFELGGHSLKAVQIVSRIYKELNVKVELRNIFESSTIEELSNIISLSEEVTFEGIVAINKQEYYDVSHAQKRLWILDQMEESRIAYNRPASYAFEGRFNREAFSQAFAALVRRHESLRTTFIMIDGELKQVVHDESYFDFRVDYVDLRDEHNKEDKARDHAQKEVIISFDLEKGPLLRTKLLHLDENLYVFLFTIHHIISDGWSIKVLIQEILALYDGIIKGKKTSLPPLKIQYKDYAAWQNMQLSGAKIKEHQEYWWNVFEGDIPVLNLPLDYSRPPIKTYNGDISGMSLTKELSKDLNDLSRNYGASLFMTLISSLVTLLYKYTGQQDIIIGSPIAGRDHGDLENQIGFYVNTLALRAKFDGDESFETLLYRVKELTLSSYKHQIYPYDRLVDDLDLSRDRSRTPLFDVNLVLQNTDIGNQILQDNISGMENVAVGNFETGFHTSKYDMLFHCNEDDDVISVYIEYNTDLFKKPTIERLLSNFNNLLHAITQNSKMKLKSYDVVSTKERELLEKFNDNLLSIKPEENIIDLFNRQVRVNPDEPAVIHGEETLTYRELNERANQIAGFLTNYQDEKGFVTGILLDNSLYTIVSILGVLKAGGTYLPLDSNYPYDRLKFILTDAKVTALLSEKKYIKFLNKLQWECADLSTYLCLDSKDPGEEDEELNELMKEELWDYVGSNHNNDIEVGGWVSSYTGEALSKQEMTEYGENILFKLRPYLTSQARVLEIGCSSGISMFGIAPFVNEYYGTDLSGKILEYTEKEAVNRGFTNIKLFHLPAHEIEKVGEGFDVVVLNSVVQSFNGYNYLQKVIKKVIKLLNDDGIIFLGDLQNLDLKNELIQSLCDFKSKNTGKGYKTKIDWSNELFVSKQFFNDLIFEIPEVELVSHSDKIATIQNELTEFRYDTILKINKNNSTYKDVSNKTKKQSGSNSLLKYSTFDKNYEINNSANAYIIYTSGSTGNPKGVGVSHKSLANYISWANNAYFTDATKGNMALITSIAFDLTLTSIFCPLTRGKKLFIYSAGDINNIITECLLNLEIDTIKLTPSHVNLANHLPVLYTGLQQIIIGGEELKAHHIDILKSFNRDMKIYNEYGPTENTVGCTMANVSEEYFGIGKPIANTKVYILDENLTLLPLGCIGEICTSGVCLANGYINNIELTEKKFVVSPFDDSERLYRTGDLGKWLDNGMLELAGRKDDQVKIRGYRIELGEVEKVIIGFNNVNDCKVVVKEDVDKQLIAYFTSALPINISDLRKHIKDVLPSYMVPEFFVAIDAFPLTTNGKVNIKLLPSPDGIEVLMNSNYVRPSTVVEKELVAIWEEILKKDNIGIRDDFFDLGGHSLKATQVISRIYKNLNKSISLSSIFSSPTIEGIAKLISDLDYIDYEEIKPIPAQEYYDISHAQKRLWILDQLEINQTAYNMPGSLMFFGDLNIEKLSKAFGTLIERHESLRTTFENINGEPKQKIHSEDSINFKLEYIDLRAELKIEETAKDISFDTLKESFDLEKGPLMRAKLLHMEENKYVFLFSMHHIISDGWSMDILINEVLILYNAYIKNLPNPLEPLAIQYKDYVYWQNNQLKGGHIEKHQQYWLEKFKGPLPKLNITTDYPRPAIKTYNGDAKSFLIDIAATQGLNELNQKCGTTLFMSLVSFIKILLHQYSGQEDIIIGSPIAGREHKDLENQIGFYLNTLPIRTKVSGDQSLEELLLQVKETTLDAYSHQLYPLDKLVEDLNISVDRSRSPLFDVMVVLQNTNAAQSQQDEELEGIHIEGYSSNWVPSKFDLSFYFSEAGDQIQSKIIYNTDLFKGERIDLMISEFKSLIDIGLLHKNQSISDLNFASELEEEFENRNIDFDFTF